MLRMVADINERLQSKLDKDVADMVQVECVTCHRGQRRPRLLADDLEEAFDTKASTPLPPATARSRKTTTAATPLISANGPSYRLPSAWSHAVKPMRLLGFWI